MKSITKNNKPHPVQITQMARIAVTSTGLLLLANCQTFNSKPLDLASHSVKWKNQSPSDLKVRDFAKQLAASSNKSSSFNPSNGIALDEGRTIALVYNPDLRVARLKAGVAKATADYAGLWDDPELSLDVMKLAESVPKPWFVGSSLSLTVPLSGRLKAEKGRAKAAMHVELDRIVEAEWEVTNDLQNAWVSWSAQKTKLEQNEKIIKALSSIVKSTNELAELGELPKTEAALFTIELTNRKVELADLKGTVDAEEQEIRTLLGLSPSAPIRLIPTVSVASLRASETRLANNNPTLNRLRREYEVSERTLLREIRKQYPDLQIGLQGEEEEGQIRIGLLGGIPLPILNANKGGIAEARAEREVAQAAYETEYERKVGQLVTLSARLKALRSQQSTIENDLIPMVERQATDAGKLLQLGEGGTLVLLESLTRGYEAKLKIINVLLQQSQVKTEIQRLLGPTNYKSTSKK